MTWRVDRRWLGLVAGFVLVCVSWLGVSSARAEGTCVNEQARAEQPFGLGLPDCRAFEMVSPIDKNDNDAVAPGSTPLMSRSSVSGDAVTYDSLGSFAGPSGSMLVDQYISGRGAGGWSTRSLTPPLGSLEGDPTFQATYQNLLFTPDLSSGIAEAATSLETPTLASGAPEGYVNLYLANITDGSYQTVTNVTPPGLEPDQFGGGSNYLSRLKEPSIAGASTDLSHVFFEDYAPLTPSAQSNIFNLYEWTAGQLKLVNVENDGTGMAGGASPGAGSSWSTFFSTGADQWHAVSSSGSRIFFTSPLLAGEEEEGEYKEFYEEYGSEERVYEEHRGPFIKPQLYVRENPDQPQSPVDGEGKCTVLVDACTVEVSASQRTAPDPHGPRPAYFWMASADGSRVFFTSSAELTNNANTGSFDNAANLYEYDVTNGVLTDLTVDANVGDPKGAAVLGVSTESEDGSYVYFVAEGDLATGAVSGQPNLYVSHEGTTSFIATLAPRDIEYWANNGGFALTEAAGARSRKVGPSFDNVTTTPDGTHFAFLSTRSLTGYNNEPVEADQCQNLEKIGPGYFFREEPGPCSEVYSYDTKSGVLVCASCDPSGERPIGASTFLPPRDSRLNGNNALFYRPRYFSEDGSRLFFNSGDKLVLRDSNGSGDVYEYSGGHVYPLSNVAGGHASLFLDASPNGDDVFIATADQLLRQDTDERVDVYDVRVGGGFPVSVPPPACDNGDACKGPESLQPSVFGAPASATFSGAGNVVPTVSQPTIKKKKPKPKHGKPKVKRKKKGKGHAGARKAAKKYAGTGGSAHGVR